MMCLVHLVNVIALLFRLILLPIEVDLVVIFDLLRRLQLISQ